MKRQGRQAQRRDGRKQTMVWYDPDLVGARAGVGIIRPRITHAGVRGACEPPAARGGGAGGGGPGGATAAGAGSGVVHRIGAGVPPAVVRAAGRVDAGGDGGGLAARAGPGGAGLAGLEGLKADGVKVTQSELWRFFLLDSLGRFERGELELPTETVEEKRLKPHK
jgi:hypothetical protein